MHLILAEAAPSSSFIVNAFYFALASLGGGAAVAAIMVAFRKREKVQITGQPVRATIEGEVEVKQKSRRLNADACDDKHRTLKEHLDLVDKYAHVEIDRIHDKLDVVDRRHADNLRMALQDINKTVADLPEKIITLLHRTGQLKDHHD